MAMLEILTDAQQAAFNDSCFNAWMAKVDTFLIARCGLCHRDLPDWMYADAFEDGMPPKEAARKAIRCANEG